MKIKYLIALLIFCQNLHSAENEKTVLVSETSCYKSKCSKAKCDEQKCVKLPTLTIIPVPSTFNTHDARAIVKNKFNLHDQAYKMQIRPHNNSIFVNLIKFVRLFKK